MPRCIDVLAGAALLAALIAGTPARADGPAVDARARGPVAHGQPWPAGPIGSPATKPGPHRGFPLPPAPDDRYWSEEFGLPDPDGYVACAVAFGGGFVIGGQFTHVGGELTSNLAMWDGLRWRSLGGGVDGPVASLAVYDGALVVSGQFDRAGATVAHGIARWDGQSWAALGDGLQMPPYHPSSGAMALATSGGRLYAAGRFAFDGNLNSVGVAVWDGLAWSALGSGLEGDGLALLPGGGDTLYAGGSFERVGLATAVGVAMWDGHAWTVVGDGLAGFGSPPMVHALARHDGRLVATGWLQAADGTIRGAVAWDGAAWTPISGAPLGGQALLVHDGRLLVGGDGVVAWDGDTWSAFPGNTTGGVNALCETPLGLVVGGGFVAGDGWGGIAAAGIGLLRDGAWQPLQHWSSRSRGLSLGGYVRIDALASYHGELMAAGDFAYAGSDTGRVTMWRFGWWNGHEWRPVDGVYGYPAALAVAEDTLYVAGNLDVPGALPITPVVRFDGTVWTALDTLTLWPRSIAHAGGVTYVAGYGRVGDGVLWRSAGGPWEDISRPYPQSRPPAILAMLADRAGLIAGGVFDSIGGVEAHGLARWDGRRWAAYGPTLRYSFVEALCECGGRLYAGGRLDDGHGLHGVMVTDGRTWQALDDPDVYVGATTLSCLHGELYAGGWVFLTADVARYGTAPNRGVARWTGSHWQVLGSGTNEFVGAMAVHDGDLYLGGRFTTAGGHSSSGIARWRAAEEAIDQRLLTGLTGDPNPFTTSTSIAFSLPAPGRVRARVYDVLGRRVATLLDAPVAASGVQSVRWDGCDDGGAPVHAGVYLVRIETPAGATLARVVRLR